MTMLDRGALALPVLLCLSYVGPAAAQDEKKPEVFVDSTYQVCDLNGQDRADEIFGQADKPVLDKLVADGTIKSYGYNAHNTGGRWRRVQYFSAPSVGELLAAQEKMSAAFDADPKNKKLGDEYAKICNAHDDYIWHRISGTTGTAAPGGAGFSTYYVCDSRESQADALAQAVYAPILDKMVADGKLKTCGWMEHVVGGNFRRLATMTAADVPTLMAARGELIASLEDNDLGDLFSDICDSHADYIWEVRYSNP